MKTGVKYLEKNYYSDGKHVVVCKLKFAIELSAIEPLFLNEDVCKYMSNLNVVYKDDENFNNVCNDTYVEFEVVGKSKANVGTISSEGDAFDEVLGRKLALTRAQEKAFEKAGGFYADVLNEYMKAIENADRLYESCYLAMSRCGSHVVELLDEADV